MPGGFAVGDIIECSFVGDAFNQTILNILHFRVLTAATGTTTVQSDSQATAEAIAITGSSDLASLMLPLLSNSYTMESVRAQDVFPIRYAPVLVDSIGTGSAGTGERTNDAGVISKQTRLSGRDQVGSIHLGPLATGSVDAGFMTPTWLEAAQTLADAMEVVISPVSGLTMEPVLWHRTKTVLQNYSDRVTNCTPRESARVMRRRTVRVGQ